MQAIDIEQVKSNGLVEKWPPQGRGVGVDCFFASRRAEIEPVSQSTKMMGNNLQKTRTLQPCGFRL
jgi:hypothetical protein